MKKIATFVSALLLVSAVSAFASGPGPFFAAGDFCADGWAAGAGNGLTLAAGVWSGNIPCPNGAGTYFGKVMIAGWGESYPHSNQPVFISGPGETVHWTFDTNTYGDGWLPATDIVMNDHLIPAGTTFEVIGGAPETGSWGSGVAAVLNGNTWSVQINIASPATYDVKFRKTGDWGLNVGPDGVGSNSDNYSYTTTVSNQPVLFRFNQATGRMRIDVGGATPTTKTSFGGLKALYR
jgi:hypothetical protein